MPNYISSRIDISTIGPALPSPDKEMFSVMQNNTILPALQLDQKENEKATFSSLPHAWSMTKNTPTQSAANQMANAFISVHRYLQPDSSALNQDETAASSAQEGVFKNLFKNEYAEGLARTLLAAASGTLVGVGMALTIVSKAIDNPLVNKAAKYIPFGRPIFYIASLATGLIGLAAKLLVIAGGKGLAWSTESADIQKKAEEFNANISTFLSTELKDAAYKAVSVAKEKLWRAQNPADAAATQETEEELKNTNLTAMLAELEKQSQEQSKQLQQFLAQLQSISSGEPAAIEAEQTMPSIVQAIGALPIVDLSAISSEDSSLLQAEQMIENTPEQSIVNQVATNLVKIDADIKQITQQKEMPPGIFSEIFKNGYAKGSAKTLLAAASCCLIATGITLTATSGLVENALVKQVIKSLPAGSLVFPIISISAGLIDLGAKMLVKGGGVGLSVALNSATVEEKVMGINEKTSTTVKTDLKDVATELFQKIAEKVQGTQDTAKTEEGEKTASPQVLSQEELQGIFSKVEEKSIEQSKQLSELFEKLQFVALVGPEIDSIVQTNSELPSISTESTDATEIDDSTVKQAERVVQNTPKQSVANQMAEALISLDASLESAQAEGKKGGWNTLFKNGYAKGSAKTLLATCSSLAVGTGITLTGVSGVIENTIVKKAIKSLPHGRLILHAASLPASVMGLGAKLLVHGGGKGLAKALDLPEMQEKVLAMNEGMSNIVKFELKEIATSIFAKIRLRNKTAIIDSIEKNPATIQQQIGLMQKKLEEQGKKLALIAEKMDKDPKAQNSQSDDQQRSENASVIKV